MLHLVEIRDEAHELVRGQLLIEHGHVGHVAEHGLGREVVALDVVAADAHAAAGGAHEPG